MTATISFATRVSVEVAERHEQRSDTVALQFILQSVRDKGSGCFGDSLFLFLRSSCLITFLGWVNGCS